MPSEAAQISIDASRQPVVVIRDGEVFANSRDVADSFGKRHDNVLRDIDTLVGHASNLRDREFVEVSVPHPTVAGRTDRAFDLTRDGFALLAMGFTGQKALKWKLSYLAAFNAMEAECRRAAKPLPGAQFDLLADYTSRTNAETSRQHALTIKEIGSTRGALLHYLKNSVLGYLSDRFTAMYARDKAILGSQRDLSEEMRATRTDIETVLSLARRAASPEAFIRSEWCDVDDVYCRAGVAQIPRRRFLSASIARSLDAFCKASNRQMDMRSWRHGGRQASYWAAEAVDLWLRQSGDMMIRTHIAKHRKADDVVVPFPSSDSNEILL